MEGRPFQGNGYRTGPFGYNRQPYGERRSSLEDTINKYLKDSRKKQGEQDIWLKNFQEATNKSLANHDESLKNLEAMIESLADNIYKNNVIEENKKTIVACKAVFTEDDGENILSQESAEPNENMPCQLPKKEDNSKRFVVPCKIGKSDLFSLAYLGSSINIMSLSLFLS